MPWFSVTDLSGSTWTTADADDCSAALVMFLSQHSPYVNHIERHLGADTRQFADDDGVMVLGISANDANAYPSDSKEMLEAQARTAGFTFPYAIDETQQAAKAFGAVCTPEFYVYDSELRLVYHGRYDASRPGNTVEVTGRDVLQAVDAARAGEIVTRDQVPSLGCSIKWRAGNEPSYVLTV
jgi:peroxiredoxin